jgi:LysM repeat protein
MHMSDETPNNRTRRPRPVTPDGAPHTSTPAGEVEDPDDALRRLESMGAPGAASAPPAGLGPLPPAPVIDSFGTPPPPRSQRPMGSSRKSPKAPRPRPAGSRSTRMAARIAVPIVFLVAVIALVGIVVNSGVMGGSDTPTTTPTSTSTKSGSVTKKYVVKSGDSLSTIAVRFKTSTAELIQLNPDLDGSTTLVVGTRIVVPRK